MILNERKKYEPTLIIGCRGTASLDDVLLTCELIKDTGSGTLWKPPALVCTSGKYLSPHTSTITANFFNYIVSHQNDIYTHAILSF